MNVAFRYTESARVLLDHSADMNSIERRERSILTQCCVRYNRVDRLEVLLAYRADYKRLAHDGSNIVYTALKYANLRTLAVLTQALLIDLDLEALNADGVPRIPLRKMQSHSNWRSYR